jgi:hypothetical protein
VLTIFVTWESDTTNFQMVLPERMMQTVLDRWVWDGWTVYIRQELPWRGRRKPVVEAPRKAVVKPRIDIPPGFYGPEVLVRGRRRG